MNEHLHGQKIIIPGSFVRSVSFDKVRQGSLSSRSSKPQHVIVVSQKIMQKDMGNNANNCNGKNQTGMVSSGLCERLVQKKLSTNMNINTNNNMAHQYNLKSFQQRAIKIKQQQQYKQMKQCTFKPNISYKNSTNNTNTNNRTTTTTTNTSKPKTTNPKNPSTRTVQQFVNQQLAYQKYKNDKVGEMRQMIRARIDKQNTFQPNLMGERQRKDQNGKKNKNSGEVYQRLYGEGIKRMQTKQKNNQKFQSIQKRNKNSTQHHNQSTKNLHQNPNDKISQFSRKNSQKSIISKQLGSKKHLITHNDFSDIVGQNNSKNITQVYQHSSNLHLNLHPHSQSQQIGNGSHPSSRQISKSQKGLRLTKNTDIQVQQICDKKCIKQQLNLQQKQKIVNPQKNKLPYINKIIRQIANIINQIHNKTQPQLSNPLTSTQSQPARLTNLTYIQMNLILQKMNFLNQGQRQKAYSSSNLIDRKYSYQIWQMLQGDVYQYIPLANLIRVIFCLLGCYQFTLIQQCLQKFIKKQNCKIKKLVLTQRQAKNIKSNFQELYLNRLNLGEYASAELRNRQEQYTFKPFVSKISANMAERYRMRMLQESQQLLQNKNNQIGNGNQDQQTQNVTAQNKNLNINLTSANLDHVQLLYLDQKRKQIKIQLQRQQQQKHKKQMQDLAMQAQKSKSKNKSKNKVKYQNMENQGEPRFQVLYELGKNSIRNKKITGVADNQVISKQCTFHPDISQSRNYNSIKQSQACSYQSNSRYSNTASVSPSRISQTQKQNSQSSNNSKNMNINMNMNINKKTNHHNHPNPIQQIKDFDKSIFRMYEARRIREQLHYTTQNQNQNQIQNQNYQSSKPPLSDRSSINTNWQQQYQRSKYTCSEHNNQDQYYQHHMSVSQKQPNYNNHNNNSTNYENKKSKKYTCPQFKQKQKHQQKQKQSPLLYLNMCMQGSTDIKIPVFKNDNMKTITHKVKLLMGLENTQDLKLQQILKMQILPTLKQIGLEAGQLGIQVQMQEEERQGYLDGRGNWR